MTRADGTKVTVIPRKAKKLQDAWRASGNIKGLTVAEIVERVGPADRGSPGAGRNGLGFTLTWSHPGYAVSVWFGYDERAIGILPGSERVG